MSTSPEDARNQGTRSRSPACRSPASRCAQFRHRVLRPRRRSRSGARRRLAGRSPGRSPAARRNPGRVHRVFPPRPPVNGIGRIGGFKLQVEDRAGLGDQALYDAMKAMQMRTFPDAGAHAELLELPDQRAAALRRRRPREGEADGGSRSPTCSTRCRSTSGSLYGQRLQPLRRAPTRGRPGRGALPLARRGHRAAQDPDAKGELVRSARCCASSRAFGPDARSATTRFPRPTSRRRRVGLSSGQAQARSSASRRRRCPRGSPSSGPTSPTRRSWPATRRCSSSAVRAGSCSWCSRRQYESFKLPLRSS